MDESGWSAALGELGPQLIQRLVAYLPNVLAAVALLALGYVLAVLARIFIRRIVAVVVEKPRSVGRWRSSSPNFSITTRTRLRACWSRCR